MNREIKFQPEENFGSQLTKSGFTSIKKHMRKYMKNGCPFCDSEENLWQICHIVTCTPQLNLIDLGQKDNKLGTAISNSKAIPLVAIYCDNCGYVANFMFKKIL